MADTPGDCDPDTLPEPANLRFLRILVTVLTATMIGGVLAIIALLVIRLQAAPEAILPTLPAEIELPAGVQPRAVTFGPGWVGVVGDNDTLLIFDPSGALVDEITITLP